MNKNKPSAPWSRLLTVLLIVLTAAFFVTNLPGFLCGAIAALICLLLKPAPVKQPTAKGLQAPIPVRPLIPALVTGFFLLTPPLTVESGALWKYPMHRAILSLYPNEQPSDLFPAFKDGVISDYHFSYLPGLLQGTGHFAVRFVTDEAHLDAYIDAFFPYMEDACYLSDLEGGFSLPISGTEGCMVWYDREFFADCPDAGVIICEAGTNPNHPHATALILDRGSGKVQFSRLG